MTELQWYAYLGGFLAFAVGCYFYYLSRNKELKNKQVKNRKKIMNFFLFIALICVIYSWIG